MLNEMQHFEHVEVSPDLSVKKILENDCPRKIIQKLFVKRLLNSFRNICEYIKKCHYKIYLLII